MSVTYIKSTEDVNFWAGFHSVAGSYGSIDIFLYEVVLKYYKINKLTNNIFVGILHADYFLNTFFEKFTNKVREKITENNGPFEDIHLIMGSLSNKNNYDQKHTIYVPLDDTIFSYGLENTLGNDALKPWNERLPIAYWRGTDSNPIRLYTCVMLHTNKNANLKIVLHPDYNKEKNTPLDLIIRYKNVPDHCFCVNKVPIKEHYNYKYIFIIDGACIASAHQWVFGSGSVPIIVGNPYHNYWFKHLLIPMVHYVPIQQNLSDLEEKVEWLVANDDLAKQIMLNALEFSKKYFSSEYQKKYIIQEVSKIIKTLNPEKNIIDLDISNFSDQNEKWITCVNVEDILLLPLGTLVRYGTHESGWTKSVVQQFKTNYDSNSLKTQSSPFFNKIVQYLDL
jgi:hypothetical protein